MSTSFCRKLLKTRLMLILLGGIGFFSSVQSAGESGLHLVSDRWRHLYSANSGVTNPAFINEENYITGRFLFASTLSTYYMHEAGLTVPIGLWSAAGVSWIMQGITAEGNERTDQDGNVIGEFQDQQNYLALTFAHNLWNRLNVGANLNIIHQNLSSEDGGARFGFGADLGLTYKVLRHPLIGNHMLGVSTQNLFTMILNTDETYIRALRLSLLSDFWERQIIYGADFVLKDIASKTSDWTPEAVVDMDWELSQKLGFNIIRLFKVYLLTGWDKEGFDNFGFALGANMPGFVNGRDLEGMFQYTSMPTDNTNHLTFYLRAEVGRHREEIYARNMAKLSTSNPSLLYNQALEAFYNKECYKAYWIFSQIAVEYPDFFKNDWVSYYQGACHECMDLRKSAEAAYKKTKDSFSRSVAVPHADLGMMRVYYRDGDYAGVENQFNELNRLGVPDSIKFHSYYLMGQVAIKQGDYPRARQLFTMVPESHPDYVFAYHSAAVANMLNDNIQGAISDLEYVIQIAPKNKAQEEAINRSYVFLGFLYYEDLTVEGALARAVTALRRVPETSYYYQDALLGLGWTGLKARQWGDCIAAGSKLAKLSTDPILQSEGNLLQAYAHAMQKNYVSAVNLLEEASIKLDKYRGPAESDLATRKNDYNSTRMMYSDLGMSISELGSARQSVMVQTSIDSMASKQSEMKAKIDEFLKYTDEYQRSSYFARSFELVKEDVDYALAKFARYRESRGMQKEMNKSSGEQEAIDAELERLRQELEKSKGSGE